MEPIFTTQTQFDLEEYIKFNEALFWDRYNSRLTPANENSKKIKQSLKRIWIAVAIALLATAFIDLIMWVSKGGSFPEFLGIIVKIVNILEAIVLGMAIIATLLASIVFICSAILKRLKNKSLQSIKKSAEKSYDSNSFNKKNSLWSYSFFDDYLEEKTENSYEKFEYSMIHKVIESDSNFYIMKSENQGYIIVKSNCTQELIDFISGLKNTKICSDK